MKNEGNKNDKNPLKKKRIKQLETFLFFFQFYVA